MTARFVPSVRLSASERATTFSDPGFRLPSTSMSLASTLMFSHAPNTTDCVSSTATGGCFGVVVVVVCFGSVVVVVVVVLVVVVFFPLGPGLPPPGPEFPWPPPGPELPLPLPDPGLPDGGLVSEDATAVPTLALPCGAPAFGFVVGVVAPLEPAFGRDFDLCGADALPSPSPFAPGASTLPDALMWPPSSAEPFEGAAASAWIGAANAGIRLSAMIPLAPAMLCMGATNPASVERSNAGTAASH